MLLCLGSLSTQLSHYGGFVTTLNSAGCRNTLDKALRRGSLTFVRAKFKSIIVEGFEKCEAFLYSYFNIINSAFAN